MDLRMERIDSTVGWIIGLEESLLLLVSFDMVDMETELFLWCCCDDDDVSCGDGRMLKPFCCEIKLYEQEGNFFVRCIAGLPVKKSRLVGAEFLAEGASTLAAIIVSSMWKIFGGDCKRWRGERSFRHLESSSL